jgi:hypothetical protein
MSQVPLLCHCDLAKPPLQVSCLDGITYLKRDNDDAATSDYGDKYQVILFHLDLLLNGSTHSSSAFQYPKEAPSNRSKPNQNIIALKRITSHI